ncbi:hypothetical protein FLO80_19875 [Aquicoccus porphyridii]|uniref:Uncharacterized protein n=1 Tax=Aquicoccus porphyridii TaxID=1852029 RepID=A0A5A9YYC6_9RHOB|nr:hypothetical protein [Aquicoccus porphyridii]KAA0909827.1 hypothetical protein FLO80_19875 [Aquicoccus porphyridii]RAI51796.1 hypothetical protein DOO74_21305 [Rhodobacteraceae bacterium AsT-22]
MNYLANLLGIAGTLEPPDIRGEEKLPTALSYAVEVMGPWIRRGEVYIPFIDAPVMEALANFQAVHQTVGYDNESKELVGYKTSDISLEQWQGHFRQSARAAQYIRLRLAVNIENGYPMPKPAKQFAGMLANGMADPPAPKKKKSQRHRDTLLAGVAKKISAAFGLPLGATKSRLSQEPPPICACVIAAAALHGHGISVAFPRADAICRKTDLPIEIAATSYVFKPLNLRPIKNRLALIPPDEFRADAQKQYADQYDRAARRLGSALPRLPPEQ